LSHDPSVTKLTLDVVGMDSDGSVLKAVTSTLPCLRALKDTFWHTALTTTGYLRALVTLRELALLEIHHKSDASQPPTIISLGQWTTLLSGLPSPTRLLLSQVLRLPLPKSVIITGMACHHIRHLQVIGI
jgi:hypothetical protein